MDPATINLVMLGLVQAAKFATTLAEQVGNGEVSPEEAQRQMRAQANSWNKTADAWFDTPPGVAGG